MKHEADTDKRTLGSLASRALGWSFLSTVLGKLGQLGIGITLARLLGPHQFGTAAVAYVALLAILSFNELGVSLAIVRWPGEPGEIAPTVATISVLSSVMLYIGLFAAAPAFAHAMGAAAATPVVRVMALGVLIDGVVAVPAALLQRFFRQDRRLISDQVNGWLGAAVSIGCAAAGFGAMSLAIGSVVGSLAGGIVIMIYSPLPRRFGYSAAKARELLKFGLPLAGSSMIVFLVANVDNFIVGHVLAATALGFYVLAWNLSSWPVNMFSQPVRNVAPALFSRLQQDPPAMRLSFTSVASLLGSVSLPVCLLLSGAASPVIELVYGKEWMPAVHALRWLALLGALRIFFELSYDYFVVLARSRVVFTVQLAYLTALVPALLVGARLDGITGVAIAGAAVAGCLVLPWYLVELAKTGVKFSALLSRLWLPLIAAVAVGAMAMAVSRAITNALAADLTGGVVALAAIGLLGLRMRSVLAELKPVLAKEEEPGRAAESVSEPSAGKAALVRPEAAYATRQIAALEVLMAMGSPAQTFVRLPEPVAVRRRTSTGLPVYDATASEHRHQRSGSAPSHAAHRRGSARHAAGSSQLPRTHRSPGPISSARERTLDADE
jgi:O-antigen/teichoic acid export membrane protein